VTVRIEGLDELEPIGRGGTSDVYRATDLASRASVAVKVLRVDASGEAAARMFLKECAAGELLSSHPNVATVHRSGITDDGRPYVVMQEAPHGSVGDELARTGPLPIDRVLEIGVGVTDALIAAHAKGVLHRDVKPGNVLLGPDRQILLADFGLAAVAGAGVSTTSSNPYTLAYAPPEVLRGRPADERGDVYSLGATLHELIEGTPPFAVPGLTMAEVLARTLSSGAVRVARADVPPAVADLVAAMLDPDPSRRPDLETVRAVLTDPDGAHGGLARAATRRAAPAIAAVFVVLAVIAGVVIRFAARDDAAAERSGGARTTTTPPATTSTSVAPYIDGTDESARMDRQVDLVTSTVMPVLGNGATQQHVAPNAVFNPLSAPTITALPASGSWRFSTASTAPRSLCTEYFPPKLTLTGFASRILTGPETTVLISRYSLARPEQAAQMFHGRTIGIGVPPERCHVDGLEAHFDQRAAPHSTVPRWADELSSWALRPPASGPLGKDRPWGDEYLIRSGRSMWEVAVVSTEDRRADATVIAALDAVGRANST
jgi:hypothetical protein